MPDFKNPLAFILLGFLPLLFILRKTKIFTRISFYSTIADWNGKPFGWSSKLRNFMSGLSRFFLSAGYVVMVVAIAEPVIYRQERVYTSRGTDVVFVLDVSPSMAARDFQGKRRIDVSKEAITALCLQNPGISYGLVSMGGEAMVTVPPTEDTRLFIERLNDVQIGSLGDGTAIGTGISTAVYHLSTSGAPKKCIVLVTDGENNAGSIHPETAAELSSRNGITVYSLGVGTSGSVPIDYVDPKTGKQYSGYLNSTFDSDALREIAKCGHGRYFEVLSASDLSLALSVISRNESTAQSYHTKTTGKDFYPILLFISMVCIVLGWSIRRIYLEEYV